MRNFSVRGRFRAKLVALVVVVAACVLAGTTAAVRADSTNGTVSATIDSVLNDQGALVLGTPTPGKNIGYQFTLTNTGTSTINHVVLNASISGTVGGNAVGSVVLVQSTDPGLICSGAKTLTCTESQLASGAGFTVLVLFSTNAAPAAGDQIVPDFSGTYSPQTQNTNNNRKPDTKSFTGVPGPLVLGGSAVRDYAGFSGGSIDTAIAQTLALPGDPLTATAGFFTSTAQMPPGFLHNNSYVGVTLQNNSNVTAPAACGTCLPFQVATTIPLGSDVTNPTNPFVAGTSTQAYKWAFTIPVPNGFKGTGVYHTDDGGGSATILGTCAVDTGGNPLPTTTAPGLCVSSIVFTKGKGAKPNTVTYSGLGVANGHAWGF